MTASPQDLTGESSNKEIGSRENIAELDAVSMCIFRNEPFLEVVSLDPEHPI